MTTYSPTVAPSDPTAVVGRRIGAWVIDLIIYLVLAWIIAFPIGGTSFRTYDNFRSEDAAESFCDRWRESNSGTCFSSGSDSDGTAFTYEASPASTIFFFVHLAGYVVLSGVLGGSLGKLAVGLRVVGPDGQTVGIGKHLLRTVLWVGDAITCGLPVVGGILMLTTKGHKRLGDMAAGTFVVDKDSVGQPVTTGYGDYGPGYAPPSYGAPGGWDVGPGPASTSPGGWGSPAPGSWGAPTPGPTAPPAGPPTSVPSSGTPAAPGAAPGAMPGADSPTWDPARNAYIQYDRELAAWMQWDDAAKAWKPISQ